MKLALAVAGLFTVALARPAVSQVNAYVDFSASKLTNLVQTNILYGPTFGISRNFMHARKFQLGGDVRGELYGTSQRLDVAALGPQASVTLGKYGPYAEVLIGFGRYNDGLNTSASATTDSVLEFNTGVDRRVSSRLSWRVFEFGYKQFYGLGGQFNPKTFSTGVVFRIAK